MAGSVSAVTNYAQLLDIQRSLFGQQNELAGLQKELSTGRRRDGLIGIAAVGLQQQGLASDAIRLQQYKQTSVQSTIYLRAIDSATYRTDLYDKSLDGLNKIASDMKSELIKTKSLGPQAYAAQYGLVTGALDRIQSILNQTDGQRSLFAGTAFTTQPVVSLNSLDASPPTALPAFNPFTGAPNNGAPRGAFAATAAGTTTTLNTGTTFPATAVGQTIRFTSGANQGLQAQITSVLPAGSLTFSPAVGAATAAADTFAVPYMAVQTSNSLPVTTQFKSDSATLATDVAPGYIAASLRTTMITTAGESIGSKPSVYIDDQLKLTYGISASDSAFQNLINGLRNYKVALGQAINFERRRRAAGAAAGHHGDPGGRALSRPGRGADQQGAARRLHPPGCQRRAAVAAHPDQGEAPGCRQHLGRRRPEDRIGRYRRGLDPHQGHPGLPRGQLHHDQADPRTLLRQLHALVDDIRRSDLGAGQE